jgi:hypothetical protein
MAKFNAKTRVQRVKELIARLESGEDIQARDLALVLTPDQLRDYKRAWSEQRELRQQPLPEPIQRYQKMLHRALMWEGRAEQFADRTHNGRRRHRTDRNKQQIKLNHKSDGLMEAAADHLRDELFINPSIAVWLDRGVERMGDGDISIDIMDMPRVITSRSLDNMGRENVAGAMGKLSKRECKLATLRGALAALDRDPDQERAQAQALAAKLAQLKKF